MKADVFHWLYTSEKHLTNTLSSLSFRNEIISVQRTWRMLWRCYLIVYKEKERTDEKT